MARSYLAAIGAVVLALLISCSGASAQGVPPEIRVPPVMAPTIPPVDQDRMACEASLKAYDEKGCDKNCTDECKSIESDLSMCPEIKERPPVGCRE